MFKTKLSDGGRVVIPAEIRKALGLDIGDEIVMRVEDGEVRLTGLRQSIARAQQLVRGYVKEGVSLSEELIADRRREAEGE